MIQSIRHKGLRRFCEAGIKKGIQAQHAGRLRIRLAALDTAQSIEDMDVPGFRLHELQGKMADRWSNSVSGNRRFTFEFREGHVYLRDYEDYH